MSYSEAQSKATARYNKKAYDRIEIVVPKGRKVKIREYALKHGKSINQFINDLIKQEMQNGDAE